MRDQRGDPATRATLRLAVYSDSPSVGGAELAASHLLAELDDGIEAIVLGVEREVVREIASRRPATEHRLLPRVRNKADLGAIREHVRAVRSLRPDLLHVNQHSPWAGQYGILAGLIASTPVLAVEQNVFPSTSPLQRRLRRALCSRLAAHVAVGVRAAREIETLIGLPRDSVETIHNGVPDIRLDPVTRAGPKPIVGAIGRFTAQKGLDVLLRALPELPDVNCVLVGDGPERAHIESLIGDLDVGDRVLLTGWVDRPRNHLPGFDVVAVPSRFEGFPLVIIEAMLAGLPVVASDVSSVSEAVEHERTGLLVPPGDPSALSDAISRLLADPGLRKEMGAQARARALDVFTARAMARTYEALYRRLLA